jgi:Fe-S cluster assembly protein SufD
MLLQRRRTTLLAAAAAAASAPSANSNSASAAQRDGWLQANVAPLATATASAAPASLAALNAACSALLPAMRVPTTRNEEYRFTDLAPLTSAGLVASSPASLDDARVAEAAAALAPSASPAVLLVTVDGRFAPALSDTSALPSSSGAYAGPLSGAPQAAAERLGKLSSARGGPFAAVNGALASDAVVVFVPAGKSLAAPVHVLHLSTGAAGGSARPASAPRVLVVLGENAEAQLVEEHATVPSASSSAPSPSCFETAVAEVFLAEGARLKHAYAARPGADDTSTSPSNSLPPVHLRATLVDQAARSTYALAEARAGGAAGALTRHDLDISQLGPDTETELRHFVLCGVGQLHDLHTRLDLEHPRGRADQLHKCIAASPTARGVFDGGVKVGRGAQQTDAGQLTRSLLLAPRTTVHAKPNLQIVADDVRCTHGCAISDLADEELFYFRARGVPAEAARGALVASFGGEVVRALGSPALEARVRRDTVAALRAAEALPSGSA